MLVSMVVWLDNFCFHLLQNVRLHICVFPVVNAETSSLLSCTDKLELLHLFEMA